MVELLWDQVLFVSSIGPYNHNLFSLSVAIINVINTRTLNGRINPYVYRRA
jgi:hypothetical protein